MRHFGFTGTQEGLSLKQYESLANTFEAHLLLDFSWLHNGDCIGADFSAASAWVERGGQVHGHPPIISTKRAYFPFDKMSEPRDYRSRNQDIVDAAEVLVACPKTMEEELRSGTWMTIRMARRKGIRIIIVWPDGSTTYE